MPKPVQEPVDDIAGQFLPVGNALVSRVRFRLTWSDEDLSHHLPGSRRLHPDAVRPPPCWTARLWRAQAGGGTPVIPETQDVGDPIVALEPLVERPHAPVVNERNRERSPGPDAQPADGPARQPRHRGHIYGCLVLSICDGNDHAIQRSDGRIQKSDIPKSDL